MHDGIGQGATRDGCAGTVALVDPLVALVRSRGLEPAKLGELHHPLPQTNPDFRTAEPGVRNVHSV